MDFSIFRNYFSFFRNKIAYFLDASASPSPTRPPRTSAAPPATATPAIASLSIFFRMCSWNVSKWKFISSPEFFRAVVINSLLTWWPVDYSVRFVRMPCRTLTPRHILWCVHFQRPSNKYNHDFLLNVFALALPAVWCPINARNSQDFVKSGPKCQPVNFTFLMSDG